MTTLAEIELVLAPNPGPFTLAGTNTWLLGRDPTYVVDPGPAIDSHVERVAEAVSERGGLAAVLLTHAHADHAGAAAALRARHSAPIAGADGSGDIVLGEGDRLGPLTAHATPGHCAGHLAFSVGKVCFTGDAVLGEGSVFVDAGPGAMRSYLEGLARLRASGLSFGCPGHGPIIDDLPARLDEYIAHRLMRERRLLDALAEGARTRAELLERAWGELPPDLRAAAALTLEAHLGKLAEEQRLPRGVEPQGPPVAPVEP